MKSTLITLGLLFATAQAGPRTLKSLLQADLIDIAQDPTAWGFPTNCSFGFTGVPGTGSPAPSGEACDCNLAGNTGAGLPALSSATYTGHSNTAVASAGQALLSTPDTKLVQQAAAEVCSCQTSTFNSARTTVKTNNFVFGGRIDVAEEANAAETSSAVAQSAGSSQRQSTQVTNNNAGSSTGAPNTGCVTQCIA